MTAIQHINSGRMILSRGATSMLNHNIISSNQLADWKDTIGSVYEVDNQLNNYYECLIECDESQAICKRICKEVLV
jgi:hypothetical protein